MPELPVRRQWTIEIGATFTSLCEKIRSRGEFETATGLGTACENSTYKAKAWIGWHGDGISSNFYFHARKDEKLTSQFTPQAMAAQAQRAASGAAMQRQNAAVNAALMRGRGRPQTVTKPSPAGNVVRTNQQPLRPQIPGMVLPNNFQLGAAAQYIQVSCRRRRCSIQTDSCGVMLGG